MKTYVIVILIVLLLALGSWFLLSGKYFQKAPTTKVTPTPTQTAVKVNGPYTTAGYIDGIDLKNNNFKLTTFSAPKKTYLVKVVDRTAIFKFVPPPPPGVTPPKGIQFGQIQLKLGDLTDKSPVAVTSPEDPTKNSTLNALIVRLSI